ncbi:hypothetical protein GPALN_016237 [Globodera pallida]|nr:hypothetical protein GPALN_016237 [Globodera pallida]
MTGPMFCGYPCQGGTCLCHDTLSYYGKDFDPGFTDFCWMANECVEFTCSYENEQKTWTKVSKGCTLDVNSTSADCSYCTGYKCNDKISPEIVWCWNGTVNDDKQAFTELKCEDASCFSLLCVGAENSLLFQSKGCLTLLKLWEIEMPFVEFGQTACKALNGTISRKLCDGNWCNAAPGQKEPGQTEPGHTEPGQNGVRNGPFAVHRSHLPPSPIEFIKIIWQQQKMSNKPNNAEKQLNEMQPYSTETDIWSLGCILYEKGNIVSLMQKIRDAEYPPFPYRFCQLYTPNF